jgi:hypothetical protein
MLIFFISWRVIYDALVLTGLVNTEITVDSTEFGASLVTIAQQVTSQGHLIMLIITLLFILLRFVIVSPLELGETKWYYNAMNDDSAQVGQVFFYYSSNDWFIDSIMFKLKLFFQKLFFVLIPLLPSVAAFGAGIYYARRFGDFSSSSDSSNIIIYFALGVLLLLLGLLLGYYINLRLFLAPYLFTINVNGPRVSVFKQSRNIMKGNKMRVVSLLISFIPSMLSCLLILPIMYVYPVVKGSMAVLAAQLIEEDRQREERGF